MRKKLLILLLAILSALSVFALFFKLFEILWLDILMDIVSIFGSGIFLAILVAVFIEKQSEKQNEKRREKRRAKLRQYYFGHPLVGITDSISMELARIGIKCDENNPIRLTDGVDHILKNLDEKLPVFENSNTTEEFFKDLKATKECYEEAARKIGIFCADKAALIFNDIFSAEEVSDIEFIESFAKRIVRIIFAWEIALKELESLKDYKKKEIKKQRVSSHLLQDLFESKQGLYRIVRRIICEWKIEGLTDFEIDTWQILTIRGFIDEMV